MKSKWNMVSWRMFFSIFITYLCLGIAVAAVFLVGMVQSYRIVQDDAIQLARSRIGIVTGQLSHELVQYMRLCDVLAGQNSIREYAQIPLGQKVELGMEAYYLQKEITNASISTDVEDLILYFPQNQSIITQTRRYDASTWDLFFDRYPGCSIQWLDSLLEKARYGMFCTETGRNWITRVVYGDSSPVAIIIVDYDLESILITASDDNSLVLIGTESQPLYTSDQTLSAQDYQLAMDTAKEGGEFEMNKSRYFMASQEVPFSDWRVAAGVSLENNQNSANTFGLFAALIVASGVLVSLVLSFVLSHRAYTPMDHLLRALSESSGKTSFSRVLDTVRGKLQTLKEENEAIRSEMLGITPILLGKMLMQLKNVQQESARNIAEYSLRLAGVEPGTGYLLFGVWYMEDKNRFFEDETNNVLRDKRTGLAYFMLDNVLSDLLFSKAKGGIAHMGDYYIVICAAPSGQEAEWCAQAIQSLESFYRETLAVTLAVTKPVYCADLASFQNAFLQTERRIKYRKFWHCEEQREGQEPGSKQFSSYFKSVRNLLHSMELQNYKEAYAELEHILDCELPRGAQNLQSAVYRIYGMIGMLVAVIDEQTDKDQAFIEQLNYEARLYNIQDIAAFKSETQKIFTELIRYKQTNQDVVVPQLVRDAEEYIAAHYTENDISVAAVAAHFHISESYLARLFKTHLKCNGLEYIQTLRVQKAKELLRTNSIKDTAQMVGFWDAQALIRVFKKHEGITPGKYREFCLMKEQNDNEAGK